MDNSDNAPFLDRHRQIDATYGGHLPHLHQNDTLQSVVFRLADSLPQSVLKELRADRETFTAVHPLPWDDTTFRAYSAKFGDKIERYLNNGYGECILQDPKARAILTEEIFRFDGIRYHIEAFVIMPNHIHLLFLPYGHHKTKDIISGIKQRSSLRINRLLGRKGPLWMRESYDRLIRNEQHYKYIIEYIERNPLGLPESQYSLYRFRYK